MTDHLRAFRFTENPLRTRHCGRCEEPLYTGDLVVMEDGEVCHAECSEGENEIRYPEKAA